MTIELTDQQVLDVCIETLQHDVRYINQSFNTYYRNYTNRIVRHAKTLLTKPSCWKGMSNVNDMRERLLAAVDIPSMIPEWLQKGHAMALAHVGYQFPSLETLDIFLNRLGDLPYEKYEKIDNNTQSDYDSSYYTGWLDYMIGLSSILADSNCLGPQRVWWMVRILNQQSFHYKLECDIDDIDSMLQRWDPENQEVVAWLFHQQAVKNSANDLLVKTLASKMKNVAAMHQQLQLQMGLSVEEYALHMEQHVPIIASPSLT